MSNEMKVRAAERMKKKKNKSLSQSHDYQFSTLNSKNYLGYPSAI